MTNAVSGLIMITVLGYGAGVLGGLPWRWAEPRSAVWIAATADLVFLGRLLPSILRVRRTAATASLMAVVMMFGGCRRVPTVEIPTAVPTEAECTVLEELNRLRRDPAAYARELEEMVPRFRGLFLMRPDAVRLKTREGAAVVSEAAAQLRRTPPLPRLSMDPWLLMVARDHAADIGPAGVRSHRGTDGFGMADRLARRIELNGTAGEAIAFGYRDGSAIVRQLVIDDGVPDRGHRTTLLQREFRYAGIALAPHAVYETVCVIDLVSGHRHAR